MFVSEQWCSPTDSGNRVRNRRHLKALVVCTVCRTHDQMQNGMASSPGLRLEGRAFGIVNVHADSHQSNCCRLPQVMQKDRVNLRSGDC